MRPILVPGAHVLRRDAATLQVGLDPTDRVLLSDTSRHRGLLLTPPESTSLTALAPVLLADDAALRSALPAAGGTDRTEGDAEALWARHTIAARALRGRDDPERPLVPTGVIVLVQPYGGPLGARLAADVRALLRRCAVPAPTQRRPGPRPADSPEELHVVVGVGEPPRDLLDARVDRRVPHLLLRFVEGRAVVGPLVAPGHSACLRCLDLHRTDSDPAWPLLLEQYSRLTRHDRADGVPEPVDAAMAAVAAGWVVRDVVAHLTGRSALTRSRTLTLTSDLVEVVLQDWPQRPDCGCAVP